nr:hypothetical protein CFP56_04331 [Quercus suber]
MGGQHLQYSWSGHGDRGGVAMRRFRYAGEEEAGWVGLGGGIVKLVMGRMPMSCLVLYSPVLTRERMGLEDSHGGRAPSRVDERPALGGMDAQDAAHARCAPPTPAPTPTPYAPDERSRVMSGSGTRVSALVDA